MRSRNQLIPFSTDALSGSTSLRASGGEAEQNRHGEGTNACVCLMIERNHNQLRKQLVVASGSFGLLPTRSALLHFMSGVSCHQRGWARSTVGPSHDCDIRICQRIQMQLMGDVPDSLRMFPISMAT